MLGYLFENNIIEKYWFEQRSVLIMNNILNVKYFKVYQVEAPMVNAVKEQFKRKIYPTNRANKICKFNLINTIFNALNKGTLRKNSLEKWVDLYYNSFYIFCYR